MRWICSVGRQLAGPQRIDIRLSLCSFLRKVRMSVRPIRRVGPYFSRLLREGTMLCEVEPSHGALRGIIERFCCSVLQNKVITCPRELKLWVSRGEAILLRRLFGPRQIQYHNALNCS
jgi:hypothetical protein